MSLLQYTYIITFDILQVTDLDAGINNQIDFSLDSESAALFHLRSIGPRSTELHSSHMLDRENTDEYSIQLFAVDRGNPRQFGETNITLIITVN